MRNVVFGFLKWILMLLFVVAITVLFYNRYIISVLPILFGALYFYATKTRRAFIKKDSMPIYQLTKGFVKIEGTVKGENVLLSPFFNQECIGYSYEEGAVSFDEDDNEHILSAKIKTDFNTFYLSNFTGRIKVNPEHIDLSLLPIKTERIDLVRHTERTLKNGDEVVILATAVKNNAHQFELQKVENEPFKIIIKDNFQKDQKAFQIIGLLMPYLVLMYLAVNYFLYFAPNKIHMEKNTPLILLAIFGVPIIGVLLAKIGNSLDGFSKTFITLLGGICLLVSLLSFPLICLTLLLKVEFYRIIGMWASIFVFTSLALIINFKKLEGTTFGAKND